MPVISSTSRRLRPQAQRDCARIMAKVLRLLVNGIESVRITTGMLVSSRGKCNGPSRKMSGSKHLLWPHGPMKEPVDHILRPRLPWRDDEGAITECGYDASKVRALTRNEFHARVKQLGERRTAMLTCMTCSDTVRRWQSWDVDPRKAIGREVEWEAGGAYWRTRNDRGFRLLDELTAIATLIEAHRAEFDSLVKDRGQRREWLEKKAAHKRKPVVVSKPLGIL